MEYRKNSYFNEKHLYLFEGLNGLFETRVHFEKGYWWTTESPNYKCTSARCKRTRVSKMQKITVKLVTKKHGLFSRLPRGGEVGHYQQTSDLVPLKGDYVTVDGIKCQVTDREMPAGNEVSVTLFVDVFTYCGFCGEEMVKTSEQEEFCNDCKEN